LQKSQLSYDESIRGLEEQLLGGNSQIDYQQLDLQLSEARTKRARIVTSIMRKRAALGVDERTQLARLTKNKYLQLRMNARALKQRIRDRLRQRKFELDRFERSYRQTTNKHKLSSHVESAVKRREPGILKLAKSYNMLCEQISTMVRQRKAPRFALAPEPIQSNGLFKLDVDDDIWQDVGLEDDDVVVRASGSDDSQLAVPRWLGDEAVRSAIKAQLILDRCIEERDRLSVERCTMQQWMQEEWRSLEHAIAGAVEDPDLEFQLNIRRDELCRLCVTWQKHVSAIPGAHPMSASWGPSERQLNEAALYEISESADLDEHPEPELHQHSTDEEDDDCDFDYGACNSDHEVDGDLLDAAEATALIDAYHATSEVDLDFDFSGLTDLDDQTLFLPMDSPSPSKKRHR